MATNLRNVYGNHIRLTYEADYKKTIQTSAVDIKMQKQYQRLFTTWGYEQFFTRLIYKVGHNGKIKLLNAKILLPQNKK